MHVDDSIVLFYVYMYMYNNPGPGIKDDHRNVRNSALFAIGQFAEHLQVSSSYVVPYQTVLYIAINSFVW